MTRHKLSQIVIIKFSVYFKKLKFKLVELYNLLFYTRVFKCLSWVLNAILHSKLDVVYYFVLII